MTPNHTMRTTLLLAALFLIAGPAFAQEVTSSSWSDGRDETQLRLDMRDAVDRDTDVANTALVFNNTGNTAALVSCTAYDQNGRVLGRKKAQVPARGLRYLRASDLSGGKDFIGSALCVSRSRMAASAVFLAPGAVTNLDVIQAGPWDDASMRFPLIATY